MKKILFALGLLGLVAVLMGQTYLDPRQLRPSTLPGVWVSSPVHGFALAILDPLLSIQDNPQTGRPTLKLTLPEAPPIQAPKREAFKVPDTTLKLPSSTLGSTPVFPAGLMCFRNGLLLSPAVDYTLAGSTLTYLAGAEPTGGDLLVFVYQ